MSTRSRVHRSIAGLVAGAALALGAAACAYPLAPSGTPTLTVRVSALCEGVGTVEVRVDGSLIGNVNPGGSTSVRVSTGTHIIHAQSSRGATWGPFSKAIDDDFTQTLTC